jgi:hypothetical protein
MTRPSVMNATTRIPHDALAAGTDERIGLVHASKELSPSAPKSGQRGGDRRCRRRGVSARSRREQLTLLSLTAGLQLAAHDVRAGAVVVDEVAAGSGTWARRRATKSRASRVSAFSPSWPA